MSNPKVSICIPTFNHRRFIEDAVRSASLQTLTDVEIVILDNASEDDTRAIAERLARKDSRIRYIRHAKNIGLIGNLNACIAEAKGEYIKILCSDDVLEPSCVYEMANALDSDKNIALVGSSRWLTDDRLNCYRRSGPRNRVARIPGRVMITECFFWGNRIGEPSAVMFRRAAAQRGFSYEYAQLVDMEMYFYLLLSGDFLALPECLCKIRMHGGQATWINDKNGTIVADRQKLFSEFGPSQKRARFIRRALWDFRMAYAMLRSEESGKRFLQHPWPGVFFPRMFGKVTHPLVKAMRSLGLRRIWRTV